MISSEWPLILDPFLNTFPHVITNLLHYFEVSCGPWELDQLPPVLPRENQQERAEGRESPGTSGQNRVQPPLALNPKYLIF